MNRTKIDWCDYSWNCVVGCDNNCPYCYGRNRVAKRLAHRCKFCGEYKPHFHKERLRQPYEIKKPSKIFIDSLSDFGAWLPIWQNAVLNVIRENPQHIFIALTKLPFFPYLDFFPQNFWLGVSVESNKYSSLLTILKNQSATTKFVSFEPLLGEVFPAQIDFLDWIIIGAQTGKNPVKPQREWVGAIIREADKYGIPVFLKNNLRELKQEFGNREEFPK